VIDITYIDWGLIPYSEAFQRQSVRFERAIRQKAEHETCRQTVIFCEHPHVITIGKNGRAYNLLIPENLLKEKQVELYHVNRGGDVTYHGPGQLVVYPILDLEVFHIGLKTYIFLLEEIIIRLLDQYALKAKRIPNAAGVWIQTENPNYERKICAIGVKSNRYITMHGLALNISTDLSYFGLINPCGFKDKGVTSLEKELNRKITVEEVKDRLKHIIREQLNTFF